MGRIEDTNDGEGARRTVGGTSDRGVGRRAIAVSLIALVVLAAVAGAWWIAVTRDPDTSSPIARAELTSLDARLTQVHDAITPIADAFTSEPETGALDVGAYRARIEAARRLVDDVNGLEVTDPDALQIRDLIVTGGSEVLAGMDLALDALSSDDASAAAPALTQVDAGLSKLQEARGMLDRLLGRSSVTRLPGDRSAAGSTVA